MSNYNNLIYKGSNIKRTSTKETVELRYTYGQILILDAAAVKGPIICLSPDGA